MPKGLLIVGLLAVCGCTHLKLERNTIHQGSTLSEIQFQQVLDNLATFSCDTNAMAWHVKITGGLVQVADQGGGGFLPSAAVSPLIAPTFSLMRNVVGQWNVDAVIESDDLELLRLAYQKAINPQDPDRQIKKQVLENVCELASTYHIVLAKEVVDEILETMKRDATPERAAKLAQIESRLTLLYQRLDETNEAGVSRPELLPTPGLGANTDQLTRTKREIIGLIGRLAKLPFAAGYSLDKPERAPAVVEQIEDKIRSLVELVTERSDEPNPFAEPWVCRGCEEDIPACTCYVGHYRGCHGECYIWVLPEHAKTLRDFTLTVLSLVPPDVQEMGLPRLGIGAANSPNF